MFCRRLSSLCSVTRSSSSAVHSRHASRVVDAWAQPPEKCLLDSVPEVARLLQQSHMPIDDIPQIGPEGLNALAEAAGVEKVVLSAWSRPGVTALSNEKVYEYTKAFPNRFVGLGAMDIKRPMKALAEMERCVKDYGFKGVRILPWIWEMPPTTNLFYPILAKCVELGIPFHTQVGHTGPLCPSEPGRPVPYIDQIALDFPELVIVGGHIGYPWTDEMIGVAWKHPNVYIDTSAHAPKYYPPALLQFMNSYGQKKVMFGTNFPQLMFHVCVKQAAKLELTDEAREDFMWRNADRVLGLGMAEE